MTKPVNGSPAVYTGTEEDEDTIELELSAEQMLALSRAAAASEPSLVPHRAAAPSEPNPASQRAAAPSEPSPAPPRVATELASKLPRLIPLKAPPLGAQPRRRLGGTQLTAALSIVSVSILLSGVTYLAMSRPRPAPVAQGVVSAPTIPEPPIPPSPDIVPVRFTNPFDAGEVFEFPPGTSETQARDAVADLLLQRARDRQNHSQVTREGAGTGGKIRPVAATGLAQRG
jgi:hypothetical protein